MQAEAAEVAELLEEEEVHLVPEEERYKLTDLDSLTGAAVFVLALCTSCFMLCGVCGVPAPTLPWSLPCSLHHTDCSWLRLSDLPWGMLCMAWRSSWALQKALPELLAAPACCLGWEMQQPEGCSDPASGP